VKPAPQPRPHVGSVSTPEPSLPPRKAGPRQRAFDYCCTNESGISMTALPPSDGADWPPRSTPLTQSTTADERLPLDCALTLDTSPPGPMRKVRVIEPAWSGACSTARR